MNTLVIIVPKTTIRVASLTTLSNHPTCDASLTYPSEDAALGEQPPVHALPANTVILNHGLIGDPEGTASRKAPVCRIQSNRGLLKRFTCATERKKAVRR
jgi:hypothetical protein